EGRTGRDRRPARRAGLGEVPLLRLRPPGPPGAGQGAAARADESRRDLRGRRRSVSRELPVPALPLHVSRLTGAPQAPRRHLGLADATAVYAGIILGSGIFVAP